MEGCRTWGKSMTQKTVDNSGAGTRYDATTSTEPRYRVVPDQGLNSNTSYFGHTERNGGWPTTKICIWNITVSPMDMDEDSTKSI